MMKIQRPLFWHQGLFLQPQHFQFLDLSFHSLLVPFQAFMEPYFWGNGRTRDPEGRPGNEVFHSSKGTFLFPDGTFAVFPENGHLEARPFEEAWVEGGKPFTVSSVLKNGTTAAKM